MTEQEQTVDLIKEFLIRIFDYTEFQISPWETLESNKFSQRYRLALRVYVENESPLIFIYHDKI